MDDSLTPEPDRPEKPRPPEDVTPFTEALRGETKDADDEISPQEDIATPFNSPPDAEGDAKIISPFLPQPKEPIPERAPAPAPVNASRPPPIPIIRAKSAPSRPVSPPPEPILTPSRPEKAAPPSLEAKELPSEPLPSADLPSIEPEEPAAAPNPRRPHPVCFALWFLAASCTAFAFYKGFQLFPLNESMVSSAEPPTELRFLGRMHPLFLHLPIGILALAGLWEFFVFGKRRPSAQRTLTSMLWIAAAASVASVFSGWFLAHEGGYPKSLLLPHFRGALLLTGLVFLTLLLKLIYRTKTTLLTSLLSSAGMLATLAVLAFASHKGGGITHGENFLTQEIPPKWISWLPESVRNAIAPENEAPPTSATPQSPENREQTPLFTALIQPVPADKCVTSHGADKIKGGLKLDSLENIIAGGDSDDPPTLDPGHPENSLLIELIKLPLDDEDHMPPENKPQLTAEETNLLEWWVKQGASGSTTLAEVPDTDPMRPLLVTLLEQDEPAVETPEPPPADDAAPQAPTSATPSLPEPALEEPPPVPDPGPGALLP